MAMVMRNRRETASEISYDFVVPTFSLGGKAARLEREMDSLAGGWTPGSTVSADMEKRWMLKSHQLMHYRFAAVERFVTHELKAIKGNQQKMAGELDDVKKDVSELKKDVSELKKDVSELKKDVSEIKNAVEELDSMVRSICVALKIPVIKK